MHTEQQSALVEKMQFIPVVKEVEEKEKLRSTALTQIEQPLSYVPTLFLQPSTLLLHKRYNKNLNIAIQTMINKMLQAPDVNFSYMLLVDNVNNHTNGSLNASDATAMLRNALINNGRFNLVSAQQLEIARQHLGISPRDSLSSRSKVIGIARNVGAQYVLCSSAAVSMNELALQMQLMLVQTGEIIWSGKGAVAVQQQ